MCYADLTSPSTLVALLFEHAHRQEEEEELFAPVAFGAGRSLMGAQFSFDSFPFLSLPSHSFFLPDSSLTPPPAPARVRVYQRVFRAPQIRGIFMACWYCAQIGWLTSPFLSPSLFSLHLPNGFSIAQRNFSSLSLCSPVSKNCELERKRRGPGDDCGMTFLLVLHHVDIGK